MPDRLADLLTGLSLVADLGFGLEAGTAQRSSILAARMARSLGLPRHDVRAAYYTALLHHIGCVGYAHETARLFGDELVVNRAAGRTDPGSARDLAVTFIPMVTEGRPLAARLRLVATAVTKGGEWGREYTATACELGRDTAERLGLPAEVQDSLFHVYDEWRGPPEPPRLAGEDIPIGARIARLAGVAVLFEEVGGDAAAVEAVRRRGGGMLDPDLVAHFVADGEGWLHECDGSRAVLDAEPEPWATISDPARVAEVFGDLADLKSPFLTGHSRRVAALACGAGRHLGLDPPTVADLEIAGHLHDVGRVGVSSAVWDKPGALTPGEWETVRLHAYHSERILARSAGLAHLATLVGRHHERLDGSGYHRGCTERDLPPAARVLAAADALATMTERRPHRAARSAGEAEERLLSLAGAGKLDADAVAAVLATAGHPVLAPRIPRPGGLSSREVEVLALVAEGLSNADIADRLVISRRTAEHHVQHIYAKVGVSGRAAATLYAVEHHLLGGDG
jgi:HD-GYP domain-containing protein (c-di-GMP phosphodiesterase class II)/DNA-binding CsgD family transcriptional regulator